MGEDGPKKPKDTWDKLSSIGGIFTAVAVAFIGLSGSYFINKKQTLSTKTQLYTQLMSQRETAESDIRTKMFQQIIASFLQGESTSQCIVDEINSDLLRLELLSRNFHEMIDMDPLFRYVLYKILRIYRLEDPNPEPSEKQKDAESESPQTNELKANGLGILTDFSFHFTPGGGQLSQNFATTELSRPENTCAENKDLSNYINRRYKGKPWKEVQKIIVTEKIEQLIKIAKRITKKQMEGLSCVQNRHRLTIDLSKTCMDVRPIDYEETDSNNCIKGYEAHFTLKREGLPKRKFTVSVRNSYPKWNQLRVRVDVSKTKKEREMDPQGEKTSTVEFWLSYFDFPLAENTLLSDKERFAVVLDGLDKKKKEAYISIIYFPASSVGLKEKSLYQQQMISRLLEKDFID